MRLFCTTLERKVALLLHVILRLYEPSEAALDGAWKPPPIFAAGETLTPVITHVKRSGLRLSWTDSQATRTRIRVVGPDGFRDQFTHRDRAGANSATLPDTDTGKRLTGRYQVSLRPAAALYDTGAGRLRRLSDTIH